MTKAHDPVEHPTHYNCREINCTKCGQRMEAGTICEALGFWLGNSFKYVYRAAFKGKQIEDLKKAKQCIEMEMQRLHKDPANIDNPNPVLRNGFQVHQEYNPT